MEQATMLMMSAEDLRNIIRTEVKAAVEESKITKPLPPWLTIEEMMSLLHIKRTKASELLSRRDFPVCREAGVLIPTEELFQWIRKHTQWVDDNTGYFRSIS